MSDHDRAFNLVALAVMRCGHLAGQVEADNLKEALAGLPGELSYEWQRVHLAALDYLARLNASLKLPEAANDLKAAMKAAHDMPIVVHQNWQNRADICG